VRLNRENFYEIRDLWETVIKRRLIEFEKLNEGEIKKLLVSLFSNDELFVKPVTEIRSANIQSNGNSAIVENGGYKAIKSDIGIITYGEFLKRLNKHTSLPLVILHKALSQARNGKTTPAESINTDTLQKIIEAFETKFAETYNQKFTYQSLEYIAQTSLFKNGDFVSEVTQSYLGNNVVKEKMDYARYLYDKAVYDSEIEHKVLIATLPKQVKVYGKLPKKSIRLPTYTGGTTSPDFIFTVHGQNSEQVKIYYIVEAKSDNPRNSDKIAAATQKKFFELLKKENSDINIEWRMVTEVEEFNRELKKIIGDEE
jgi:type III restriction enzyme